MFSDLIHSALGEEYWSIRKLWLIAYLIVSCKIICKVPRLADIHLTEK